MSEIRNRRTIYNNNEKPLIFKIYAIIIILNDYSTLQEIKLLY